MRRAGGGSGRLPVPGTEGQVLTVVDGVWAPADAGGGGGGIDFPVDAGPHAATSSGWVALTAEIIPADGPDVDTDAGDTNVQALLDDHAGRLDAVESDIAALQSSVSGLLSDVSALQSSLSAVESDIAALQSSDSTQSSDIASLQSLVSALSSSVATNTSSISTLQGQVSTLQSQYTSLSSTVSTHTSDISTLQSSVSSLSSTVSSHSTSISTLQSDVSTLQSAVTALQTKAYTRTTVDTPFAIGNAPTYAALLTIPIAASTSLALDGYILLTGGNATTPTSGLIAMGGVSTITARRPSTGAPTVSGTPAVVGGTIAALAAQVVVSGNDIVVQARATGGPSVTATYYYRVETDTP